jgi:hypothetical protein
MAGQDGGQQNMEKRMNNLVLFEEKQVRRVWHEEEWWFVITDVIAVLTDFADPAGYLRDMRRRDVELGALSKGGGNLPPPLNCPLKQRAESKKSSAGMCPACYA